MAKKAETTKKTTTKKPAAKKAPVKKSTTSKKESVDFAVVKVAGTQLLVKEGVTYTVNRVDSDKGAKIVSEEVLLVATDSGAKIGKPFVKGAKVQFEFASHPKEKKLRVFKYKAKARYRKTIGHRSHLSKLLVKKIQAA